MKRIEIGSIGSRDSGDPGKRSAGSIAGVAPARDAPRVLRYPAGMKNALPCLASVALAAGILLLGGCSSHAVRPAPPPQLAPPPPAYTGIPACDAYLASYIAGHRAAGIFPPDQLQSRYATMRHILIDEARDPTTRAVLAQRCMMLNAGMRAALQGKSGETAPAGSAASH